MKDANIIESKTADGTLFKVECAEGHPMMECSSIVTTEELRLAKFDIAEKARDSLRRAWRQHRIEKHQERA